MRGLKVQRPGHVDVGADWAHLHAWWRYCQQGHYIVSVASYVKLGRMIMAHGLWIFDTVRIYKWALPRGMWEITRAMST